MVCKRSCSYVCMLLAGFLYSAANVQADEEVTVLSDVVVTGSTLQKTPDSVPFPIKVISAAEIQASGSGTLSDYLNTVAGITVTQAGGPGNQSLVYLRGADPNFTAILINGIKLNDPNNTRGGSYDLQTISIDEVERIEIAYGTFSSVYGTDALAGVINIITSSDSWNKRKQLQLAGGSKNVMAGSFAVRDGYAAGGGYELRVSARDAGEQDSENTSRLSNISLDTDFDVVEGYGLSAFVKSSTERGTRFPEDSGGKEFAVIRDKDQQDIDELVVGLGLEVDNGSDWLHTVKLDHFSKTERINSPGIAPGVRDPFGIPPNDNKQDLNRSGVLVGSQLQTRDHTSIYLGLGYQKEEGFAETALSIPGSSINIDYELERETFSVASELSTRLGRGLSVHMSLRADKIEQYNTQFSPSTGLIYSLADTGTRFKLNWGKGFKAPSFFALGNAIVGNPDLKPERSKNLSFGIEQHLFSRENLLSLNLFQSQYTDLVDFDEGPPPRVVNRENVDITGAELELSFKFLSPFTVRANYQWLDIDVESGTPLRNRPESTAGLHLGYEFFANMFFGLDWQFVDETYDSSIPTGGQTLEAYSLVNTNLNWAVSKDMDVKLMINNVLDEQYQKMIGFAEPRTNFMVKLLYNM